MLNSIKSKERTIIIERGGKPVTRVTRVDNDSEQQGEGIEPCRNYVDFLEL